MNEFLDLMEKHIVLLNDIIDSANRKFDAVAANDINAINKSISEDEANTLRFRGLDKKREALIKELGVKTFAEYVETLNGEEKQRGLRIYEILNDRMEVLKAVNGANEKCIRLNLMQIDGVLDMLGGKKQSTYAMDGEKEKASAVSRFKSKKI